MQSFLLIGRVVSAIQTVPYPPN